MIWQGQSRLQPTALTRFEADTARTRTRTDLLLGGPLQGSVYQKISQTLGEKLSRHSDGQDDRKQFAANTRRQDHTRSAGPQGPKRFRCLAGTTGPIAYRQAW